VTAPVLRFNKPALEGHELEYMQAAVEHGHTSASGPYAKEASELLRNAIGARDVLLTTSCTDALEMSAMLLDIGPGDTVIVPSFTFVSTALAFARQGARLLFCDIEDQTLGLDPACLDALLDDTVRAVVPVHYAGVGCDIEGIRNALVGSSVDIVEDNAHGLFGRYRGTPLGALGRFATLSFHETKNFICGEGGALVVNEERDVERAHILYDKGTNRRAFMLGQVDKYSWHDVGSSFGMSDVLAAFLYAQLEQRDVILHKRRVVFDRYARLLEPLAAEYDLRLPVVPPDRAQAYHMFYVLFPDRSTRDAVLASMRDDGVQPTFHYVPLHSSPGGRMCAARPTECPVTDDVSGRLLRLPFHNNLSDDDAERVVTSLRSALVGSERAKRVGARRA
jgi:dTDP-4-amino-4,6-dideoxygalactose transaminase